jgi:sugar lactone lactonase YvrE
LLGVTALLLLAVGGPAAAQIYDFTTLAGNPGYQSGDGVGAEARFNGPVALAIDAHGNLFVSDAGNYTIRQISPAGVVTTLAGQVGYGPSADGVGRFARFTQLGALVLDLAGNLIVSDGPGGVRQVSPAGVVTTLADTATGRSMVLDRNGNRFVVVGGLLGDASIQKVSPAGVVTTVEGTMGQFVSVGPNGLPRFTGPAAVALDGAERLVYADVTGDHINMFSRGWRTELVGSVIRRIEANGAITVVTGASDAVGHVDGVGSAARFRFIASLAADGAGNLFAADRESQVVRKITPAGVVTTLAGQADVRGGNDGTGSAAQFNSPEGLAVDANGNVFVSDRLNNAIRKVTPAGVVTTLAGSKELVMGAPNLHVDGAGSAARFEVPSGVAVDSSGTLFVADGGAGGSIRKVSPSGAVTTLALSYAPGGAAISTWQISSPIGVAIDAADNLYVSDSWMVRRITPAGVVSTLAGVLAGGGPEGAGDTVSLGVPSGVAVDRDGNVYVADGSVSIRRITPGGYVTVLAGEPGGGGSHGSADGVGRGARFNFPRGVAVDAVGRVYVADRGNYTIRRITPTGVVTTVAGVAGARGATDGVGAAARFLSPVGVAIDTDGNLLVADGTIIRRMTPEGAVTTIAGLAEMRGSADGTGSAVRFGEANAIAVDSRGRLFVTDSGFKTIRQGVRLANPARLTNVSVLALLDGADDLVTVGAIIGGAGTRGTQALLLRAVGPSLAAFGVRPVVEDPRLELFRGQTKIDENDDWGGAAAMGAIFAQVAAFPFAPAGSHDAALYLPSVVAGNYSVRVAGRGTAGGSVLAELYEATPNPELTDTSPRLTNLSVLKRVNPLVTAGFIIRGDGTKQVLIRAAGPSLAAFGVDGWLADPRLELFDGQSRRIAANDNWSDDGALAGAELSAVFARVGAFALGVGTSKDAALLVTLSPGNYTVQVSATGQTTGVALVEVYEVP